MKIEKFTRAIKKENNGEEERKKERLMEVIRNKCVKLDLLRTVVDCNHQRILFSRKKVLRTVLWWTQFLISCLIIRRFDRSDDDDDVVGGGGGDDEGQKEMETGD